MNANTNTGAERDDEPTDNEDIIVLRDQKGRSEIRRREPTEDENETESDKTQSRSRLRNLCQRIVRIFGR